MKRISYHYRLNLGDSPTPRVWITVARIQVRILPLLWKTIVRIEDVDEEYVHNRAEEILSLLDNELCP